MSGAGNDPLGAYLREIEKASLLAPEQEAELARQITAGIDASRLLDRGALTQESVEELRVRVRDGERAKRRLVESNLRIVVAVARGFEDPGFRLLDLIQEGNIGLMRAVERFDPAEGISFSDFAKRLIRQAILNAIGGLPPAAGVGLG